ncbi:hypothetical protein L9F63_017049, partial [Diploptera punctata]
KGSQMDLRISMDSYVSFNPLSLDESMNNLQARGSCTYPNSFMRDFLLPNSHC